MDINQSQVLAVGRHVVSYTAGAVTVAVGAAGIAYSMHGISADQASQLTDSFKQLGVGVTSIVGALATIVSILTAAWAAYRASPTVQIQSAASVPGTIVVTTPSIAAATPELNIQSNTEAKVVSTVTPNLGG